MVVVVSLEIRQEGAEDGWGNREAVVGTCGEDPFDASEEALELETVIQGVGVAILDVEVTHSIEVHLDGGWF